VLLVVVFAAGQWFWDWRRFLVWFHLLLGVAYAFHVTLTWHILKGRQSDISEQGYLFSAVIIFLGNVLLLLMGIPLLAGKLQIGTALRWWLSCTAQVLRWLVSGFSHLQK